MTRRELALAVGIAALALAPYLSTVHFGAAYDDRAHLLDNAFVQHPENLRFLFSPRYLSLEIPDQGRPAHLASLLVDRAVHGRWLGGYHLTNALLHALVAVLAFLLARRLEFAPWPAAAGAALFAVHPACTEAVAAISNREDVLAALFTLIALLATRRFLTRRTRSLTDAAYGAGAVGAFALALLSKELAIVTPALLVAVAWASPRFRPAGRVRVIALAIAGAAVIALVTAFQLRLGAPSLTVGAGGSPLAPASGGPLAAFLQLGSRATHGATEWMHALPLEAYRLARVLAGWPLSAEHDVAPLVTPAAAAVAAVALLAIIALGALAARHDRRLALAPIWALVATLPVMVSPWLLAPAADRYLYLPALGVWLVIGAWLARPRPSPWPRLALAALLAFFVARTADRVHVWRDDVALFTDAVRHAPRSARAWQNLGAGHLDAGHLDAARPALERAVALDPALLAAHLNLASLHLRRRDDDAALRVLDAAVRIPPIRAEVDLHALAFRWQVATLHRLGQRDALARAVEDELARPFAADTARAWRRRLHDAPHDGDGNR